MLYWLSDHLLLGHPSHSERSASQRMIYEEQEAKLISYENMAELNAVVLSDEKNVSQAEFVIHVLRDQGKNVCRIVWLLPQ